MLELDVEKLMQPLSDDAPCGENLEYDAAFLEMEKAAQAKPDQQFGDTLVPGEEPQWRLVKSQALELLNRTRDLRVITQLLRAVLHTDGLPSFRDCLQLIRRLVDERWESVHPQLDPDDDNDPTLRVNLIAGLCDGDTTLKYLRETTLVQARAVGRFTFRDYEIATGEVERPASSEEAPASLDVLQAAFLECELEELQANAASCRDALEAATAIEVALTRYVGVTRAASLQELQKLVQRMAALYGQHLERRGAGGAAAEVSEDGAATPAAAGPNGQSVPQRLTGEISSRDDVMRALDKICDYYRQYEPSSPVPLLLKRAKRLTNKSFLEIVRDLSPDAMQQVLALGGEDGESGE